MMVREFQRVIGREARAQILETEGRLPDAVIACVGGGSNAIGLFADFIADERCADRRRGGRQGPRRDASMARPCCAAGRGVLHGAETYVLQDADGQIADTWSVSAGLDYPAVGPEHAHLKDSGRARLCRRHRRGGARRLRAAGASEGIICAFEVRPRARPCAEAGRGASRTAVILVNLSGRGDKDMAQAQQLLGPSA